MKFKLVPFQSSARPDQITGEIELGPNRLSCEFELHGDLDAIVWPNGILQTESNQSEASKTMPPRTSQLWQHTCFELFLGEKGDTRYWEVNVAPDGRWQCYQFDDVRLGTKESGAFNLETHIFKQSPRKANFQITLNHGLHVGTQMQIGISVVLESTTSGLDCYAKNYYALRHCGSKPDFHHRDSHSLQLKSG